MADTWIKMRTGIRATPRFAQLVADVRKLPTFPGWAGQEISPHALRCAVVGLLHQVWGSAREYGKFEGDDLILKMTLDGFDELAELRGFGSAMVAVGWAFARGDTIVLPKFAEFNVARTGAERQEQYRLRRLAATPSLEGEGEEEEEKKASETDACVGGSKASLPTPATTAIDPVVMTFPTTTAAKGKHKGLDTWPLTQSKFNEYLSSFPDVNLQQQLLKARQWLIDNHRKTYTGMPAYLGRWLGKAQDESPKRGDRHAAGGKMGSIEFGKKMARSLFDEAGSLHTGDPDE